MSLPKVLAIEDGQIIQEWWALKLRGQVELIPATTIEEAYKLFDEHGRTLAAIAVDGRLHSETPNTPPLIQHILESGYQGPIIAISAGFNDVLMQAGCTREATKRELPEVMEEILSL